MLNIKEVENYHKEYILKLFNNIVFCLCYMDGIGFIRVFKKGIHWKDTTKHRLSFSERNNLKKDLTIGRWRISILNFNRPNKKSS